MHSARYKRWAVHLCAALVLATLVTGCAGPRFVEPADPLVLLGDGAALYAALPVAPNRTLLNRTIDSLEGLDEKEQSSAGDILDRTDFARLGLYADRSITLVLTGDFPKAAAPFVFPESQGWKRVKSDSGTSWYASGSLSAAIPVNGLVCVTVGSDMELMLARAKDSPYPPVSEALASLSALQGSGDIAFSLVLPDLILPAVLGNDLSLPVERLDGTGTPNDSGASYGVNLSFTAPDAPRARALATLLRLLSGSAPETEGSVVSIRAANTSIETLAGFTAFLLF